ncbi:MAG: type II toxin-antitoxin system RelE/ParE family toxin [Methylophilaceae bacterium]
MNQLSLHPLMGRVGRVADTRELVVSLTHFVVPYRVNMQKNLIEILALMHNARQWPESFE